MKDQTLYEAMEKTSVLVRMKGWQKADLEAAAEGQARSVNNFILRELGIRRKWKDRDQETGTHLE